MPHRRRPAGARRAAALRTRAVGKDLEDIGYVFIRIVFIRIDAAPLRPSTVTHRFRRFWKEIGLPPVRLHDLRHGAAILAHCARAELKTIWLAIGGKDGGSAWRRTISDLRQILDPPHTETLFEM